MSGPDLRTAQELLAWALDKYGSSFAISTSFQKEGMILVDMAAGISPGVRVFTLDTGRLPEETHGMMGTVRSRYGIPVEVVLPDAAEVEAMVAAHGANLFYTGEEMRALCCEVRKVRPLARKLNGLKAWATGLRRSQAESRESVQEVEEVNGIVRISPLAGWTAGQVDSYIKEHDVPVHPLYASGYASIGCAPCTRAIAPGEPERAGRWWWEQNGQKECGIHFTPGGTVQRG